MVTFWCGWRNFSDPNWWDDNITRGMYQMLLENDETCLLKLLFPHGLGTLFPCHFRMRFWPWKSGRAWLMSSFYQKQQEFISGITPNRGKEDLLPFWPRTQRNGTPQFKPQEAYRMLLIFLSLHSISSLPPGWQLKSFRILLQNEAATSSSMQHQLTVSLVSLMAENQLLQNVHLPWCRYTHLVNCVPSLRTTDYSPFC